MTAIETLRRTPIPERLATLPKDPRGYPIFWTIQQDDGSYDFKHILLPKVIQSGQNRLCGLCGQQMNGPVAFIGGPKSCASRVFSDPPMHEDCARYAFTVCPYITRLGWAREQTPYLSVVDPEGSLDKPENMALFTCRHYITFLNDQNYPLFRAYPALSIEWQKEVADADQTA